MRLKKYREVGAFIETHRRNLSSHTPKERGEYCNWFKNNKKFLNTSKMKEDKVDLFKQLLEMGGDVQESESI